MLDQLAQLRNRKTGRFSSYDRSGRNSDAWNIPAGESRVLADIRGPARITHIWMTQSKHYREVLLKITWDNARYPSVLCPLGDFFCLGHGMVNSFQSLPFSASTHGNSSNITNRGITPPIGGGCALNCYLPMPFRKRAVIELINQSDEDHGQYFYVNYETLEKRPSSDAGYFHAEFRRTNPFRGWAPELTVNTPPVDVPNTGKLAWKNNYVILETKGRGHYIGCNLSVTNFQGTWWGEGDDMIWVDGYKWPPDLHGTGSEDYLNQAWGMQPNAFLRNGSSIYENHTGGYQTSYVFHLENPVRFKKEIKVTIEHGHGNHLGNEMSSAAYWYAAKPTAVVEPPAVEKRLTVLKDLKGKWIHDPERERPGPEVAGVKRAKEIKAASIGANVKIRRLKSGTSLAALAGALAKEKPFMVGGKVPMAELRFGVAGQMLALHARLFDARIKRSEPDFWSGSVLEVFGAQAREVEVGQVVLLPAVEHLPQDARAFFNGAPCPSAGIRFTSKLASGGYEISALIPMKLLRVKAGSRRFMLDFAVGITADRRGQHRCEGSHSWPPAYNSAIGYNSMTVI